MRRDDQKRLRTSVARGAALVEFALVLPLFIFFLAGVYTLARVQSQTNIVAEAAYQIALIGATTSRITGDSTMMSQGSKVVSAPPPLLTVVQQQTNYLDDLELTRPAAGNSAYYQDSDGTWYVEVDVTGTISSIFYYFLPRVFTLNVSVTAPYLYGNGNVASNTITGTENNGAVNCDGTSSTVDTASCATICGCQNSGGKCLLSQNTPICYSN